MFGLFKKKEKPAAAPASAQSGEMRAFAANFHPKEMTVLVVTGAKGFASDKAADEELWTASMELTAWMEDDSPDIQRGEFKLVAKGDETLMNFLRQRVPRDFILKCRVRLSLDGTSLLLTNLPEPGFDPDLKAILEEQKKPVAVEVEGLGKFMLNRSVGVLQAEIQFMGQGVQLCFDKDEDRAACGRTAKAVLDDLIALDEKARSLAADKLLELANPNQPLLRRLLIEAPGTYHHAIIVANLSEAAAEKIGANPLLARTGAYFHDIGKLKRPLYFKENQRGENPHDHTDAYVSAAIVTSHTADGLALAQKHHLPPEIQRIIVEHHGDTPVMYFYHKALQQADGKPVDIKDFRYGGNRPTTKESAIVMLADTIEAAVRSMPDPTPQAIQRFIERLGQRETAKTLGVSQMQISRMERRVLARLRELTERWQTLN